VHPHDRPSITIESHSRREVTARFRGTKGRSCNTRSPASIGPRRGASRSSRAGFESSTSLVGNPDAPQAQETRRDVDLNARLGARATKYWRARVTIRSR
jgi:hypothetical protein